MLELNDPATHAELMVLHQAGEVLDRIKCEDCVVYADGQPCSMLRMRRTSKNSASWPKMPFCT